MSGHVPQSVDEAVCIGANRLVGVSAVGGLLRESANGSLKRVSGLLVLGVLLRWNNVSGTTAANSVHWSDGFAAELVALEFFIEGEHGAFGSGVSVTHATAAAVEWAGGWLEVVGLGLWSSDFSGSKLAIVAGAANAGVVEGGVWSWFVGSEAHFDCWFGYERDWVFGKSGDG